MNLFLVRHGNTFSSGEPVLRAGSSTDYPLVVKGREQAEEFAKYLKDQKIIPQKFFCSPLIRTKEFAEIVRRELSVLEVPVIPDEKLNELDYGKWSGLTDEQIEADCKSEELADWNNNSIWPKDIFGGTEEGQIEDAQSFLKVFEQDIYKDTNIIGVSSNGKLRYFLKCIEDEFEVRRKSGTLKVKTGNYCKLQYRDEKWHVHSWNVSP